MDCTVYSGLLPCGHLAIADKSQTPEINSRTPLTPLPKNRPTNATMYVERVKSQPLALEYPNNSSSHVTLKINKC